MDGPATGAVDMGAEGCGGGIGGCAARDAASAIDRFISASCDGLPAAAAGLGAALGTLGAEVDGAEGVDTPPGDPDIGLVGAVTRGGVAPEPPDPPGRLGITGAPGPSAGAGALIAAGGGFWGLPSIPEASPPSGFGALGSSPAAGARGGVGASPCPRTSGGLGGPDSGVKAGDSGGSVIIGASGRPSAFLKWLARRKGG